MGLRSFDTEDNRTFWKGNRAAYHGTKTAGFLVRWTRDVVGRCVLDAGAGDGSLVRAIRAAAPRAKVLGVDLAPKSEDVEEGDLSDLRFHDEEFDTIYCSEVIEHVSPQITHAILRELVRVLGSGGHLVLTTPFDENLNANLITCPGCESEFHRWGHQQSFRDQAFAELASEVGLQPLSIAPVRLNRIRNIAFLGPAMLRSTLGRRIVRGRSGASNRTLIMVARKS